jgi:uncharacterized membrane protein
MRKSEWLLVAVGILAFATGAFMEPHLPAMVASHWDAAGQVNGYLSRAWGAFTFPAIIVFVIALFLAVPRMDPKRNNIAKFRDYFDCLTITLAVVLYYFYALTLLWNLGYPIDMMRWFIPAFALLFYVIGIVLPHTTLNFTIGIRTPWTILSETVWRKTHAAGGIAFKISAVITLAGVLWPSLALWFLLVPIIASAVGLFVYSYVLYEGEKKS